MFSPVPSEPSADDLPVMERAFHLIGSANVTMAICYADQMLGGELNDGPLVIQDFADRQVVDALLDGAGANAPEPSAAELAAEEEALHAWFAELDAELPAWPSSDEGSSLTSQQRVAPVRLGSSKPPPGMLGPRVGPTAA